MKKSKNQKIIHHCYYKLRAYLLNSDTYYNLIVHWPDLLFLNIKYLNIKIAKNYQIYLNIKCSKSILTAKTHIILTYLYIQNKINIKIDFIKFLKSFAVIYNIYLLFYKIYFTIYVIFR